MRRQDLSLDQRPQCRRHCRPPAKPTGESGRRLMEQHGIKRLPVVENDTLVGLIARADLVLCRSGASTVAEVTAAAKPAIFIPLPTAADDHQRHNAATLASAGAARLLGQAELTPERLVADISSLLRDRAELERMSTAARAFAHPDAAAKIASLVARVAGVQMLTAGAGGRAAL